MSIPAKHFFFQKTEHIRTYKHTNTLTPMQTIHTQKHTAYMLTHVHAHTHTHTHTQLQPPLSPSPSPLSQPVQQHSMNCNTHTHTHTHHAHTQNHTHTHTHTHTHKHTLSHTHTHTNHQHIHISTSITPTNTTQLTGLIITGVGLHDAAIKPHVGHSHTVLSQGSSLVRADCGGGAQGFHSFQVLHQAVLAGHTFGRQSQTHLYSEQRE